MTHKKTYTELKKSLGVFKTFCIIFIIVSILLLILGAIEEDKNLGCKSQLSLCQKNVPTWTLKVNCTEEGWFGTDYYNQVITIKTSNYSNYLNWLEGMEDNEYLDCEIIE